MNHKEGSIRQLLRVPVGPINVLRDFDAGANPGFPKGKGKGAVARFNDQLDPEIDYRQEQMYAEGLRNPASAPSVLWCSRVWTPLAREVSFGTSSARSTRPG